MSAVQSSPGKPDDQERMRRAALNFLVRSGVFLVLAAVVNLVHPSDHAGTLVALILSVLFARAVWQYRSGR